MALNTGVRRILDSLFFGIPESPDDWDLFRICIAPATTSKGLSLFKLNDNNCSSNNINQWLTFKPFPTPFSGENDAQLAKALGNWPNEAPAVLMQPIRSDELYQRKFCGAAADQKRL